MDDETILTNEVFPYSSLVIYCTYVPYSFRTVCVLDREGHTFEVVVINTLHRQSRSTRHGTTLLDGRYFVGYIMYSFHRIEQKS